MPSLLTHTPIHCQRPRTAGLLRASGRRGDHWHLGRAATNHMVRLLEHRLEEVGRGRRVEAVEGQYADRTIS